jgi:hypothetical protein
MYISRNCPSIREGLLNHVIVGGQEVRRPRQGRVLVQNGYKNQFAKSGSRRDAKTGKPQSNMNSGNNGGAHHCRRIDWTNHVLHTKMCIYHVTAVAYGKVRPWATIPDGTFPCLHTIAGLSNQLIAKQTFFLLKNTVVWEVTPCGSCKNGYFGGMYSLQYTLMIEVICSSDTSVLTRATRRHIPEDGNLHSHRRENLKSYTALTGWAL